MQTCRKERALVRERVYNHSGIHHLSLHFEGVLTGEQDVKQPRIDLFMSPSRTPAAAAAAAEQSDEVECKKTNDNGKLQALLTESSWKPLLIVEFNKPYFRSLENKLAEEFAKNKEIFPPRHQIFNALNLTSFHKVKVVILGQDPYHDNKQVQSIGLLGNSFNQFLTTIGSRALLLGDERGDTATFAQEYLQRAKH